jgi:hypothetical protein
LTILSHQRQQQWKQLYQQQINPNINHLNDYHDIDIDINIDSATATAATTAQRQVPSPWILFAMLFTLLLAMVDPIGVAARRTLAWSLRLPGRIMVAPFLRVRFADFWLADQLCSLSLMLQSIALAITYLFRGFSDHECVPFPRLSGSRMRWICRVH